MATGTTWTREELRAECERQETIHRLQAGSDRVSGHISGAVFHDRKAEFWAALVLELHPAPAPFGL